MNNLITKEIKLMNTTITIKVVQSSESTIEVLNYIEEAFEEFNRIVKSYTRFDDNSELSNLNRNSYEWVQITDEFIWLIEYMINLSQITDGVFDPTIIDFLEVYGYDKNYDFSKLDNPMLDKMVEKIAKERPSWREIKINKKENKVRLYKNQRIDLGGIGKGYAIDCAFKKLNRFDNFLIDAGGDIRAKGKNSNDAPWNIELKNKKDRGDFEIIGTVNLDNNALACSGSWARNIKQFHHLIDPKTGKPKNIFKTVYVQAPTALEADAWATILFVGGNEMENKIPSNFKYFYI